MIAPSWLRDGAESALWTSQTLIDTALTGGPWASGWAGYCAGGIASHQFDLGPSSAEIRTLEDCFRLVGQECAAGPEGSSQTHRIPNSAGKVAIITAEWGAQYSRYSHIPLFSVDSMYGLAVSWPGCVSAGLQPTPAEKVVIFGGHIGLLDEEIAIAQFEWMAPRVYPCGVVRHILRAARNHFESNLPSASTRGRAGGVPAVARTREFSPSMMGQVYGQDRLSAVLSGVAPGTRARYLTACRH